MHIHACANTYTVFIPGLSSCFLRVRARYKPCYKPANTMRDRKGRITIQHGVHGTVYRVRELQARTQQLKKP
jgi:hypothetical protein